MEAKNHRMLEKALQMLEYIASQPNGASLPELCRHLEMPKSSAYSLLMTFWNMGYLKRGENGRFIVGMRLFELGSKFVENSDFFLYARDVLQDLAKAVGETAHLAALDGGDVVYLGKCEGAHLVRMSSSVGKRLPAYATALGKALLSGKSQAEVRELYRESGLRQITPHTITDMEQLLAQLEEVRRTGFAFEREESSLGVQCAAVPVCQSSGAVYLGLSVAVPVGCSQEGLERMERPLQEARSRLERVL